MLIQTVTIICDCCTTRENFTTVAEAIRADWERGKRDLCPDCERKDRRGRAGGIKGRRIYCQAKSLLLLMRGHSHRDIGMIVPSYKGAFLSREQVSRRIYRTLREVSHDLPVSGVKELRDYFKSLPPQDYQEFEQRVIALSPELASELETGERPVFITGNL